MEKESQHFENESFWFCEAPDGSFGLILALLGHSDPKMGSKMSFNIFRKSGKKKMCKTCLKQVQIWPRNLFPTTVQNEIAGLRHFLPRTDFLGIIFCVFESFCIDVVIRS